MSRHQNDEFFDRRHLNIIQKWWINIDKVNFLLAICLIFLGLIIAFSASPIIAKKISSDQFFFIKKQLIFVFISIAAIIFFSFLDKQYIKIISIFGFLIVIILMIMVLFIGSEAKGAKRWLNIFGFTIQPSEFAKVFFLVFNAFLLTKLQKYKWYISYGFSSLLFFVIIFLLLLQPDFGMTLIFAVLWLVQLFIFGLPVFLIISGIILTIIGGITAYFFMPHVTDRINRFLNFNEQNYQVERSIDGYINGGFFGLGPGEGFVKQYIPDAHTDFIFAVIAEEFGLVSCLFFMVILFLIFSRVIFRVMKENDLFAKLASIGLVFQLALQSLVNIGVSIGMLPTKGMTLPFISYGGSSLIAVSIGFGIILSLTKKKYDDKINYDNVVVI